MKLLIGGSPSKKFHLEEFRRALEGLGVQTKLVMDTEIYTGFPSRKISDWFQTKNKFERLISDFKPDVILVDRQRHFAQIASNSLIPLIIHLRGNIWEETKWAKETTYNSFFKKIILKKWTDMATYTFQKSTLIIPICKYLEKIVKQHYPDKNTGVISSGIDASKWYQVKGMNLKHPCVGLVQGAVIWGKTQEMLILKDVLEKMPDVTFYWAGDGPYREKILTELEKYDNFKWLGNLEYPDKVREFLTEIDVYALVSGIDMSPLTLQEAQLMKKPVIATNVGGIPEIMKDNETGFLVEKGDADNWIEKLSLLINDEQKRKIMGEAGRKFIEENFSWNTIAKEFLKILEENNLNKIL
jgi:glycosyltransferase involved in cell wall biosynthesis